MVPKYAVFLTVEMVNENYLDCSVFTKITETFPDSVHRRRQDSDFDDENLSADDLTKIFKELVKNW